MIKKHPDVKLKGKTVDMSDLEQDSIVMFQKKYTFSTSFDLSFQFYTFLSFNNSDIIFG